MMKNWKIAIPVILLTAIVGGICLSAGNEPPKNYEPVIGGDFQFVASYSEVLKLKDSDVGKEFADGATIDDKDNAGKFSHYLFTAADEGWLYKSKELDLTARTGNWQMAILVDDSAKVTIEPLGTGAPPATTLPQCMGSALWSDVAFHFLNYTFEGGRKYTIKFDYNNSCHRKNLPNNMWDYDGVIAYVFPARNKLDVDVDSNNSDLIEAIGDAEDSIEDVAGLPGKVIELKIHDCDLDGIPDFADGYNKDYGHGGNQAGVYKSCDCTPMRLEFPAPIDSSKAKIRFTYSASDPDKVTFTGTGAPTDLFIYHTDPAGKLRIWKKDGSADRKKESMQAGGDYVPTGEPISVSKFGDVNRAIPLYIEAVDASAAFGDLDIKAELDPDGDGPLDYVFVDIVKVSVVMVNLGIDVNDEGEVNAADDLMKVVQGAIIFENWDNDDGDPSYNPDKDKKLVAGVDGEDDLVPIYLKQKPASSTGTMKLEVITGDRHIKVWSSKTKRWGTEVNLPATWNLANKAFPETLYVEGYGKSSEVNDVELELSCTIDSLTHRDKVKITVVRLNLGVASYRPLTSAMLNFFGEDFNHTALVWRYEGKRTKEDLNDDSKWKVMEMDGSNCVINTLKHHKDATSPYFFGFFSVNNLTDQQRNKILHNALYCGAKAPGYTFTNAVDGENGTWNGTIGDIAALRCDGLVEVCYELAGVSVWGKNGDHYPIQNYPSDHNVIGKSDPQTKFSPIVQRGGVSGPNGNPTLFVQTSNFEPESLQP